MNNESIRHHYDAFKRIEAFGEKYGASFPVAGTMQALFEAIGALVPRLEQLGVGQLEGAKGYHASASAKQLAAERLRENLRVVRDTAKSIAEADRAPSFASGFMMPRSKSFEALLTHARTVVNAVRPRLARFTAFELPTGILDEIERNIYEVEQADGEKVAGRSSQVGGTAGLIAVVDEGISLRRQLLPLVRNRFKHDPVALAEWESASRIVRIDRAPDEPQAASAS